jgi:hypothetical protein
MKDALSGNNVVIDGERFGGSDLLDEIQDIDQLRNVAKELRAYLHREREYVKKLEHDHGLARDALDTIQYQQGLSKQSIRRIVRMTLSGLQVGAMWPGQKFLHPDQPTREAIERAS